MQQTHSVQAAIPVASVLVVVAHVHLADIETMTRQESLRKERVGQEELVVVAILLPGCAKGLVAVVALVPKPSEAFEGLATGLDDHDARLYVAPSTRLPHGDVAALCVTEDPEVLRTANVSGSK